MMALKLFCWWQDFESYGFETDFEGRRYAFTIGGGAETRFTIE